jgi:hypothetical protein
MALAFADIQTILRTRLSEASASAWTDAELQDYTYLAEHEILQLLPSDAFFDIQEVEDEVEIGSTNSVLLPSTALIQQLTNLIIYDSAHATTSIVRLRIIEPGRTSEYAASTTNPVCWFEDGKLFYSPDMAPDGDTTIKFRFTPAPTEGAIILPDRFASLIVSYAFALAIAREDVAQSATEKNEFYQRIMMLERKEFGMNKLNRGR